MQKIQTMQKVVQCFSIAVLVCGCAKTSSGPGPEINLNKAEQACPGPEGAIVVRVIDSPELSQDDPVAFVRDHQLSWIVSLKVVDVVEGEFESERLGVLVHSPSMFANQVWGFGSSPQTQPAGLELHWTEEFCLFEVTGIEAPEPNPRDPDAPFKITAPQVHSAIVG